MGGSAESQHAAGDVVCFCELEHVLRNRVGERVAMYAQSQCNARKESVTRLVISAITHIHRQLTGSSSRDAKTKPSMAACCGFSC